MAEDEKAITVIPDGVQLGSIQTADPKEFFDRAKIVADALVQLVDSKKLFTIIQGRKYLQVSGWAYAGAMMGVVAREVSAVEKDNGDVEALVELIRSSDGAVIGRGSAIMGFDEWIGRPRYARRSMAITRAEGKAFRLAYPWLVALAGYEATPAEEMDGLNIVEGETKEIKPAAYTRPFMADELRKIIKAKVAKHKAVPLTEEMIKLAARMLEYPFAVVEDARIKENMRHSIVKYLLGQPSLKDAKGEEVSVILDWLKPTEDSGHEWSPDPMACKECQALWTAANVEAGQGELPGTK